MTRRHTAPALIAHECGVVLVEFLIAFVPVFVLFLAIVQLALLAVANLVVRHAAFAGARAAVVVLDDEPRFYAGVARGALGGSGATQSDWEQRWSQQIGLSGTELRPDPQMDHGPRLAHIERAVYARIAAIAPDASLALHLNAPGARTSLGDAIGTQALSRIGFALGWYAAVSTAVTLPEAPGSTHLLRDTVAERPTVTVRVTHLFACLVPVAASLLCSALRWDAGAGRIARSGLPDASRPALSELPLAARAQDQSVLVHAGIRFAILRAESTLPAQSARYAYQSETTAGSAP